MNRNLPIGIFDSGVGGLTVYRALHERLPSERYVYLGDTARVPYGTKSLSTVERYAIENARFLEARGIKLLVVACNTASALALPAVRRGVSVPVVGMIEPGARAAVGGESAAARVGVIATESTVKSGAYRRAIEELAPGVEVTERACPLFVALAEEGWAETDVARAVAEEYLRELREREVSALVLGCTHYPILRRVIQETLGARVVCVHKKPGKQLGAIGRLRKVFAELLPDVVHTHQVGALCYAGPAARWAGVPVVVHTEHGQTYGTRLRTRILGRLAGRFVARFFCVSRDIANEVATCRIVSSGDGEAPTRASISAAERGRRTRYRRHA